MLQCPVEGFVWRPAEVVVAGGAGVAVLLCSFSVPSAALQLLGWLLLLLLTVPLVLLLLCSFAVPLRRGFVVLTLRLFRRRD